MTSTLMHQCYDPQQLQPRPQPPERDFSGASSSSSSCDAQLGVLTEDKKTLSRFFNSLSRSIVSFFAIMVAINESNRLSMPVVVYSACVFAK